MRGRRRLTLGGEASERARKSAVGILQVLSGLRTPGEASEAMGVSINRYYQLEGRAVLAMLHALEPQPRGRKRTVEGEIEKMRKAKERAEREAARSLALVRASQKAMGFVPLARKEEAGKKKGRRARVRARALIEAIEVNAPTPVPSAPATAPTSVSAAVSAGVP